MNLTTIVLFLSAAFLCTSGFAIDTTNNIRNVGDECFTVKRDKKIFSMCATNPSALTVPSGSTILFETNDCVDGQVKNETDTSPIDESRMNPATGPVYIQDAKPGDTLKVSVQRITVADRGFMAVFKGQALLGDRVTHDQFKFFNVLNNKIHFGGAITMPTNLMIGVIGVAPKGNLKISNETPGSHGGNLDSTAITQGSVVYLPVNHDGALLAIGDLHAAMGDGEISISGIETAGSVVVKVEVLKGNAINNPIIEDENYFYTVGSDLELKNALKIAAGDMHDIVMKMLNLTPNEAYMLISVSGRSQICQVVNPLQGCRFAMPKAIIGKKIF